MSDQGDGAIGLSEAGMAALRSVYAGWSTMPNGLTDVVRSIVREHTERAWDEGKREGELLAYNAVLAQHAINRRAYANERRRLRDNRPDLYANPYAAREEQDRG